MRIGLLGAVEAHPAAGNGVAPLRGVRLRGLLARLALDAGRPVGTSVLVDDLWGEEPPDGVGNALQALVSRLRRAVGPELVGTDAGAVCRPRNLCARGRGLGAAPVLRRGRRRAGGRAAPGRPARTVAAP